LPRGRSRSCNSHILNQTSSWTQYTLQQAFSNEPGEVFNYVTGLNIVSHTILENVTDMSIEQFTAQYLLSPLGVEQFNWNYSPSGETLSAEVKPRDMAKFGQLFYLMDNGMDSKSLIVSG
jgi:CubicO group peptidase (beta-lactamase class C family)